MSKADDLGLFPLEVEEVKAVEENTLPTKKLGGFGWYSFLLGIVAGLVIAISFVLFLDLQQKKRPPQEGLSANINTEKLKDISSGTTISIAPKQNEQESNINPVTSLAPESDNTASASVKHKESLKAEKTVAKKAIEKQKKPLKQEKALKQVKKDLKHALKEASKASGVQGYFSVRVGTYQYKEGAMRRQKSILALNASAKITKERDYFIVEAGPYSSLEECKKWVKEFSKNAIETASCRFK